MFVLVIRNILLLPFWGVGEGGGLFENFGMKCSLSC